MKNLIPLILIFISLAVIVFILGKKIPKLRDLKNKNNPGNSLARTGKIKRLLFGAFALVRNFFVYIAEWIVKKAKKVLHLIHFWLIKLKSGKKDNEQLRELEAKQELIKEEEINLQRVINEDLASGEISEAEYVKNDVTFFDKNPSPNSAAMSGNGDREFKNGAVVANESSNNNEEKTEKIEQFFTQEETDQEEIFQDQREKQGRFAFFSNLFKRKKRKDENRNVEDEMAGVGRDELYERGDLSEGQGGGRFSDGIVNAGPDNNYQDSAANLIKEVVSVKRKKKQYNDEDEELGVDRSILEKKIIGKISQNPKDIENYRQLGELYIKMKNYQDAQEAYKFILKVSPRDIDSKRKLEKIKLLKRING